MAKQRELDGGAAQIVLTLEDGMLIVRHTNTKGEILHKRPSYKGTWNSLWRVIRKYPSITPRGKQ